jgi:glucosamine-6-phosphate deaminase
MRWQALNDAGAFAAHAADVVAEVVTAVPHAVIALPTGRTPRGLYAELVRRAAAQTIDFKTAFFFNLDEYLGLPGPDPRSFAAYLRREFLVPAGVPLERTRLLRGDAEDPIAECRATDAAIAAAGGVELAILGLGANGHIAFNEPGTDWHATTHLAALSAATRTTNASADGAPPPPMGITLGIATLRAARQVLLLVDGASKRGVTALLGHPRMTVLVGPELP